MNLIKYIKESELFELYKNYNKFVNSVIGLIASYFFQKIALNDLVINFLWNNIWFYPVQVWHILVLILFFSILICEYYRRFNKLKFKLSEFENTINNSLNNKIEEKQLIISNENIPDYCSYIEDIFKTKNNEDILYRWKYVKNYGKYEIEELSFYCIVCKCELTEEYEYRDYMLFCPNNDEPTKHNQQNRVEYYKSDIKEAEIIIKKIWSNIEEKYGFKHI